MALNKLSEESDAIANLYRAALYLARGSKDIGFEFLVKAKAELGEVLDPKIENLIQNKDKYLKNKQDFIYWAEKILDQYKELKISSLW